MQRRRHRVREAARTSRAHDAIGQRPSGARLRSGVQPARARTARSGSSSPRRAATSTTAFDYAGPQRTPADPTKPNANLYVLEPDPKAQGKMRVRQLTFQLNMERFPSFMQDGRLIFTAEKRAPGFYQLALRRRTSTAAITTRSMRSGPASGTIKRRASWSSRTRTSRPSSAITRRNTAAARSAIFNRSIGVDFTSADRPTIRSIQA